MDSSLEDRNRHELRMPRWLYGLLGSCGGFAVGVWLMVERAPTTSSARLLVVLVAGMLFGTIAGLNLYASRKWGQHKAVFVLRWTLACGGAAGLIALLGAILRVVPASETWQIGTAGAVLGFFFAISWLIEAARSAA